MLQTTHATLLDLQQREMGLFKASDAQRQPDEPSQNWKRRIAKHHIMCLECGATFRQLGARHLRTHDLNPQSYRTKYHIPKTQPLSSRLATAQRRAVAKRIRPWEQAAAKRASASQATAQTSPKVTSTAKKTPRRSTAKRAKSS